MAFASALTRLGVGGPGFAYNEIQDKAGSGDAPVADPNENQIEPRAGGTYAGYQRIEKRKKLKAIIADDEEFMNMVAQALPGLIKYLK